MRIRRGPAFDATILGTAALLALAMSGTAGSAQATDRFRAVRTPTVASVTGAAAYVGVWLSADDAVRLDVSADGTYERSVAGRKRSATGRYHVDGSSLLLTDDSGVRTTVTNSRSGIVMAGYQLVKI